ncbi:MAG: tetratricopeptide repeat protein [Endomicrobium sp.]|jgi:tol-pal system protein YbgF|nr:tetratricopeptide repeat protein [Endomicrobium sp.]
MEQRVFLLLCFMTLFISGCIPLNSHEITDLKDELSHLQIQYRELKQNYADLYTRVDSACTTLEVLNVSAKDLQNKVSVLNQNINDLEIDVNKKSKNDNVKHSFPSSIYQSAYSDYSSGKFDLAYSGFQAFVEKYPNSESTPQAQFYMGECFYSNSMWEKALEEYKKVEQHYKKSGLVSSARLKIALCYELLDKHNEALNIFLSIVKDFPQSPESLMAKEKLKIYNNAQKR